jgi:hypothetical protein
MPIEFLHGRPLKPEEVRVIRVALEQLDSVETNDPEIRALVARNWPHLLSKLPPPHKSHRGQKSTAKSFH